jgi:acetate kinase
MSKILVLNVGSTSIKYAVFDSESRVLLHREKLSSSGENSINQVFENLLNTAVIGSMDDITQVMHRVVFGGTKYTGVVEVVPEVLTELDVLSTNAPLHNPPALIVINYLHNKYPALKQVAVFDTAFHTTITPEYYLYGLPYAAYSDMGIRRFGFHGISYMGIAKQYKKGRVVACHLGGGASVCAMMDGRSVNCSMGYSPEEGLIMATRVGDIGAGALLQLMDLEQLDTSKARTLLNTQSGLLGISGTTGDMRELLSVSTTDAKALLAINMYVARVVHYIGGFVAQLGGLDTLVFSGGVGEGSGIIRDMVCQHLSYLGLELGGSNIEPESKTKDTIISAQSSQVQVAVVIAEEEKTMMDLAISAN